MNKLSIFAVFQLFNLVKSFISPSHTFYGKKQSFIHKNSALQSATSTFDYALIFDCDGVIIETEELHRIAYNAAFNEFDLKVDGTPVDWTVDYYDVLQNTVGGGKGKMFFHFRNTTKAFPTSNFLGKIGASVQHF